MDAVTPKAKIAADEHSHVVRPADMEWKPTRFAGCEVKTLYMDTQSGVMTALMPFALALGRLAFSVRVYGPVLSAPNSAPNAIVGDSNPRPRRH